MHEFFKKRIKELEELEYPSHLALTTILLNKILLKSLDCKVLELPALIVEYEREKDKINRKGWYGR
jgi:hypothetical protein